MCTINKISLSFSFDHLEKKYKIVLLLYTIIKMTNESIKSLMTLSSRSDGSTGLAGKTPWRNAALHDRCTLIDMIKLKEAFKSAYRNKLLATEFRNLLKNLLNVEYDDDEYKILFMKVRFLLY